MVNMVNTAVNSNIYAGRKPGSKYNQSHTFQQKEVLEVPDGAEMCIRDRDYMVQSRGIRQENMQRKSENC